MRVTDSFPPTSTMQLPVALHASNSNQLCSMSSPATYSTHRPHEGAQSGCPAGVDRDVWGSCGGTQRDFQLNQDWATLSPASRSPGSSSGSTLTRHAQDSPPSAWHPRTPETERPGSQHGSLLSGPAAVAALLRQAVLAVTPASPIANQARDDIFQSPSSSFQPFHGQQHLQDCSRKTVNVPDFISSPEINTWLDSQEGPAQPTPPNPSPPSPPSPPPPPALTAARQPMLPVAHAKATGLMPLRKGSPAPPPPPHTAQPTFHQLTAPISRAKAAGHREGKNTPSRALKPPKVIKKRPKKRQGVAVYDSLWEEMGYECSENEDETQGVAMAAAAAAAAAAAPEVAAASVDCWCGLCGLKKEVQEFPGNMFASLYQVPGMASKNLRQSCACLNAADQITFGQEVHHCGSSTT